MVFKVLGQFRTALTRQVTEAVHIRVEEKIQLTANRDGGLDEFILTGMMLLKISDEEKAKLKVKLDKLKRVQEKRGEKILRMASIALRIDAKTTK